MSKYGCMGTCKLHGTEEKPERCRVYPEQHDTILPNCTYYFENGQRKGECHPEVCQEHNCCAIPRAGGDPGGVTQDALAGGLPCKHLEWHFAEPPMEKDASDPNEYAEYNNYRNQLYKILSGEF